jgi:hypothetical protein
MFATWLESGSLAYLLMGIGFALTVPKHYYIPLWPSAAEMKRDAFAKVESPYAAPPRWTRVLAVLRLTP